MRWRITSGVLFLLFGALLLMFLSNDIFYVQAIEVRGNTFLEREEVFAYTDIADLHMFWLDPEQIRENVLGYPSVADVTVEIGWPPNLLTLHVQERQPAVVWSAGGEESWLDIQGREIQKRSEMPNLLHIRMAQEYQGEAQASAVDFDADFVLGALRLSDILPEGEGLRYHPAYGLGWTNELGWEIWMGSDGSQLMSEKIKIYNALLRYLTSRAIDVAELNIANPDAPFYRLIWEL